MTLLQIYERVNLRLPMEQRVFFDYYNDTVDELETMYSPFVFEQADEDEADICTSVRRSPARGRRAVIPRFSADEDKNALSDDINVRELYHSAIADNILYLGGAGDNYRASFIEKSHSAWLEYWHRSARGARVRRKRW